MKKILMKWAAVLCCVMITSVFTSCLKSEEEMQNDLIGTWTESNNLFTDILKINADGSFSFKCHIAIYNGEGHYRYERTVKGGLDGRTTTADLLILNFGSKSSQTLEIQKLNSSTLEMTGGGSIAFHLRK
jgi:hypothetical protein